MEERRDTLQVRYLQYGAVGLAMAVLFIAAGTLNGISERLHAERANEEFESGVAAEQSGNCTAAVEHYRTGLELASDRSEYRLALARCLWREGRSTEADTYLGQVLDEDPTSGEANLLRGQILSGDGAIDSSVTYFQRAITGGWPLDDAEGRFRARLQLVELLRSERRWRDLLPQLLQLREEPAAADERMQFRIAEMFLEAQAAQESRDMLTALVRSGIRTAPVYATLGRAYMMLREPQQGRQAFSSASLRAPGDPWIEASLAYATLAARLDPQQPGLSDTQQRSRMIEVGSIALGRLERCAESQQGVEPFTRQAASLLDSAARRPASVALQRLESLAVSAWTRTPAICSAATPEEYAAGYVIAGIPEPVPAAESSP